MKDCTKGFLYIFIFDEVKNNVITETVKLPFQIDKHGNTKPIDKVVFADFKESSNQDSLNLICRVSILTTINEQKKGTAPIFKQALWGCHKITNGSANMFLATAFDKTDFSVKRHSKQLLNKSQFISCRLGWEKKQNVQDDAVEVANLYEVYRRPPLSSTRFHVTLLSGSFEKGKKKSEKNVEVLMSVVDSDGEVVSRSFAEGSSLTPYYRSCVTRHSNTPMWSEMATITLPDSMYDKCYLKLSCAHVTSSELTHKSRLEWMTYFPLTTQVGSIVENGTYYLRLLPKNTFIKRELFETDVLMTADDKTVQKLVISTHLDSVSLTDTSSIYKITKWKLFSKSVLNVLRDLNATDISKCLNHTKSIFKSILEILDSCSDGKIIALCMEFIFSCNSFWNSNDEFKQDIIETVKSTNFISGILKIVSWSNLVIKDQKSVPFRKTIKALPMLATIISKSFLQIKEDGLLNFNEIEQFKVILANLLVDISMVKIVDSMVLTSQFLKYFPESLKIFYDDENISVNEFVFHMISSIKCSQNSSWKEYSGTRKTYLEHLGYIIRSEYMKSINLQERYFQDILDSLVLTDGTDYSDLITMSCTLLDLCDLCKVMLLKAENKEKLKKLLNLLMVYLKGIYQHPFPINDDINTLISKDYIFVTLGELLVTYQLNISSDKDIRSFLVDVLQLITRNIPNNDSNETQRRLRETFYPVMNIIDARKYCLGTEVLKSSYNLGLGDPENRRNILFVTLKLITQSDNCLSVEKMPFQYVIAEKDRQIRKLIKRIQASSTALVKEKLMTDNLLSEIVAMALHTDSCKWILGFVDCLLCENPSLISVLLTSIHDHKAKIKISYSKPSNMQLNSSLTPLILYQLDKILAIRDIEKKHIFSICGVQSMVQLLLFYEQHQCWKGFLGTFAEYKSILLSSDCQLEAAELIIFTCDSIPPQYLGDRTSLLSEAAKYYSDCGLWQKSLDVFSSLENQLQSRSPNNKATFEMLAEVTTKKSELYMSLASQPEIPFHYFLVGFYGSGFRHQIQNTMFVFRGAPLESLSDFTNRLLLHYPGVNRITSAKIPSQEEMMSMCKSLQVIVLTPFETSSSFRCTKFKFEISFVRDKAIKNELLRVYYKRYIFELETPLPAYKPFSETRCTCIEITPIEMAIEQIKSKTADLEAEATKASDGIGNIPQFQLVLNGVIDAAVNGGTVKLKETFLVEQYHSKNPNDAANCKILTEEIDRQKTIVGKCLQIHDEVCPDELRQLHKKMMNLYHTNSNENLNNSTASDPASPDAVKLGKISNQRSAMLREISRRGSKLKKTKRVKRMTSLFFDSSSSVTASSLDGREDATSPCSTPSAASDILINVNTCELEKLYVATCQRLNMFFNEGYISRRPTLDRSDLINLRYSSRKELKGVPELPTKTRAKTPEPKESTITEELLKECNEVPPLIPSKEKDKSKQDQVEEKQASPAYVNVEFRAGAGPQIDRGEDISVATKLPKKSKEIERLLSLEDAKFEIASGEEIPIPRSRTIERSHNIWMAQEHTPLRRVMTPEGIDLKKLANEFTLESSMVQPSSFKSAKKVKKQSLNELISRTKNTAEEKDSSAEF